MNIWRLGGSIMALLTLSACVTVPSGPSIMSLPGSSKTFDQFRADDLDCRQFASVQIGGTTPTQAANDATVRSAAVGTAVGAAAGALIDGASGAGIGAGFGMLTGALVGSSSGYASGYSLQQRYDIAYVQCMYSKGHKVPVSGRFASANERPAARSYTPPPPPPSPQ
jgi:phage tail tape-measure protein